MTKLTRQFVENLIKEEVHAYRIGMYSELMNYLEVEHGITTQQGLDDALKGGLKLVVNDGWYSRLIDIKKD